MKGTGVIIVISSSFVVLAVSSINSPSARHGLLSKEICSIVPTNLCEEIEALWSTETSSPEQIWNAATALEWSRAIGVEEAATRDPDIEQSFPFIFCSKEADHSGIVGGQDIKSHYSGGYEIHSTFHSEGIDCAEILMPASVAATAPNSVKVQPLLAELKVRGGLKRIKQGSSPYYVFVTLCSTTASEASTAEAVVHSIVRTVIDPLGTKKHASYFLRGSDLNPHFRTRDLLWRIEKDFFSGQECASLLRNVRVKKVDEDSSFTISFLDNAMDHDNEYPYDSCLLRLIHGLSTDPRLCRVHVPQNEQSATTRADDRTVLHDRNGGILQTTYEGGIRQSGAMFAIKAEKDLFVIDFDIHTLSRGDVSVEIYTKAGHLTGAKNDSLGWTLIGRSSAKGQGLGNATPLPLAVFDPVGIKSGNYQSFYVTLNTTDLVYTFSTNTLGEVLASNSDMTVYVGCGVAYPFGDLFCPRAWNGAVRYNVSAAPTSSTIHASLVTTYDGGLAQAGNMFEIEAKKNVTIETFELHALATNATVEIYTKAQLPQGVNESLSDWKLIGSSPVEGQGFNRSTPLPPTPFHPVEIRAGSRQAFYITLKTPYMLYTRSEDPVGTEFASNSDLAIFVGYGVVYKFAKSFGPRKWNGVVRYTTSSSVTYAPSPTPSTETPSETPPLSPSQIPTSSTTPRPSATISPMPTPAPSKAVFPFSGSIMTTFNGTMYQSGNMFDVVALRNLAIVGLDINSGGGEVEIYTKKGTHQGYETNSSAWTMIGSLQLEGTGPGSHTPIPDGTFDPVRIAAGERQSFYVTLTLPEMIYSGGTNVGDLFVSNDDIEVLVGVANAYQFGKVFRPRTWNGEIRYSTFATISPSASPTQAHSNPHEQDEPSPSPTLAPPTITRFDAIKAVLQSVTSQKVLEDTSSPQHAAMVWIAEQDERLVHWQDTRHLIQRFSLVTLYFGTGGENAWIHKYNFLSSQHECTWNGEVPQSGLTGVFCHQDNETVDHVVIPSNNMTGPLPEELSLLSNLTFLGMWDNELSGPIPNTIGKLSRLNELFLQFNQLWGPLPASMGNLSSLKGLFLEDNNLGGIVPDELENMESLRALWLSRNNFTGSLDVFCGLNLIVFYADCLASESPPIPAKVDCSCCAQCCDSSGYCLPNSAWRYAEH